MTHLGNTTQNSVGNADAAVVKIDSPMPRYIGQNKIRVTDLEYHRNGISGVGFVTARFTFKGDGRKRHSAIATVFDSNGDDEKFTGYCSVLVEDSETGKINIHSRWRGDHFERDLRWFIKSAEGHVMMWPSLYPTVEAYHAHQAKFDAAERA